MCALRTIAISNQKGGCGKTTTAINFASVLALLQKKVLLIDLDPQGHSTCGLGVTLKEEDPTLYELLSPREESKPEFTQTVKTLNPYLDLLPCHERLVSLEEELVPFYDREKRLKQLLGDLRSKGRLYDYAIIDCPPNLGLLTYNALEAAAEAIIPIEPSFFSLHGLAKISETLKTVNQRRLFPLQVNALLTIFDSRTRFAKDVYDEVKTYFQSKLFKTIIHDSVLLKEAASAGKSIVDYDSKSSAFKDYFNLAVEFLERQWEHKLPQENLGWSNIVKNKYGPRRVSGGILFQAFHKEARSIEIAGDFNQWIPEPLVRRDDKGLWQKVLAVEPGSYCYKLIVDGEWQMDPTQPAQRANVFGTYDSCMEIR